MICWKRFVTDDQAIATQYGNTALYFGIRNIPFPQTFSSVPSAQCSQFRHGTGGSWGSAANVYTTSMALFGYDFYARPTGTNCEISWMAIGRWK